MPVSVACFLQSSMSAMRVKCLYILLLLAALLPWGGAVVAQETGPTAEELALLDLINQARRAPLAAAAAIGMDPEAVLADLPKIAGILQNGLPPLAFNRNLYLSATEHNQDMLRQGYYDRLSPDGRTPAERMATAGYEAAVATGESLGMLGFLNYIPPQEAVAAMFENLLREELDPGRRDKRNILDPNLMDAGVSFLGGQFDLGGPTWNVYVLTCDFASTGADPARLAFGALRRMNEARRNPAAALAQAGIDPPPADLDLSLSPLAWSGTLAAAAAGHGQDMLERLYFDSVSPEGTGPGDRIAAAGYEAAEATEILAAVAVDRYAAPEGVLDLLVRQMMVQGGVAQFRAGQPRLFHPGMREAGVSVLTAAMALDGHVPVRVYLLVADLAEPLEPRGYVLGSVFVDENVNGRLDPGEEAEGLTVELRFLLGDPGSGIAVKTGPLGWYQLPLFPGLVEVVVLKDGIDIASTRLAGYRDNRWIDIRLTPPVGAGSRIFLDDTLD